MSLKKRAFLVWQLTSGRKDDEEPSASYAQCDELTVVGLGRSLRAIRQSAHSASPLVSYLISGHLRVVQALTAITLQCDVSVSEHGVDEIVHSRLLELAAMPCLATERSGALDFLLQEVRDV